MFAADAEQALLGTGNFGNAISTNRDNQFSYDAVGNLFSVHGNTAAYNAENQMTGVSGTGVSESITYDGLGERVQKTYNGSTTTYVYDAFGLAEEYLKWKLDAGLHSRWWRQFVRDRELLRRLHHLLFRL